MTHAFVFQCLVQVLQLSAPFNPRNKKAGSLEILLILIYAVAGQISVDHIFSVSHREKCEHPTSINRYKIGLSSHIYSISFSKSVHRLSLKKKIEKVITWLKVIRLKTIDMCKWLKGLGAGKENTGFESQPLKRQELF